MGSTDGRGPPAHAHTQTAPAGPTRGPHTHPDSPSRAHTLATTAASCLLVCNEDDKIRSIVSDVIDPRGPSPQCVLDWGAAGLV